jgi:hypothetical protein
MTKRRRGSKKKKRSLVKEKMTGAVKNMIRKQKERK